MSQVKAVVCTDGHHAPGLTGAFQGIQVAIELHIVVSVSTAEIGLRRPPRAKTGRCQTDEIAGQEVDSDSTDYAKGERPHTVQNG